MKKYLFLAAALALVGAGCASTPAPAPEAENNSAQPAAEQAMPANAVYIQDFAFSPATLKVKKGTTVTWTNKDAVAHSAVADSGKWKSDLLSQNGTYSHTFDTVGKFTYHCGPHTYMKGTIEVTE
jgi:plastocyanin